MFNNKENKYKLRVENERLKIESETLTFKLTQLNEKYELIKQRLRENPYSELETALDRIKQLEAEIGKMKLLEDNDQTNMTMKAENAKLKSEVEIQKAENKHLHELLNTYRNMPDVKQIVENLSSLAVPNIEELRKFSQVVNESKINELCDVIKVNNESISRLIRDVYGYHAVGGSTRVLNL